MKVIGLTGGVGSGKSLVAELLKKEYGAQLLITDEIGHAVMEPGTQGFDQVTGRFGTDIIGADGRIDRSRLAEKVFEDEAARAALNAIIHPHVIRYAEEYIAERSDMPGLIVLESALLFESGCDRLCDSIWYVRVSDEVRKKRLADSRGYSEEKTESIMKRQLSAESFLQKSNVVIGNNGSPKELEATVREQIKNESNDQVIGREA